VAYLDVAEFTTLSIMPPDGVAEVEATHPGFISAALAEWSSRMDSVLRKRYAVPFTEPPEVVKGWLARLVTVRVYGARGFNPSDAQSAWIEKDAESAWNEIREAADSKDGLYDLPISPTVASSAVVDGGPLGVAETSPYLWTDMQRENAEDGHH